MSCERLTEPCSDGKTTNLHAVWDTSILQKLRGGGNMTDAVSWAANLTKELNSGQYASEKAGWLSNMNIADASSSALAWAQDANAYVCTTVMPNGVSAVQGKDLGTTYYEGVVPDVEVLIARGPYISTC